MSPGMPSCALEPMMGVLVFTGVHDYGNVALGIMALDDELL